MIDIDRIQLESERKIRSQQVDILLKQPLDVKEKRSNGAVKEFVSILGLDNVAVSTSGGKDSAVLSKLCKKLFPDIKHIMFNTGLEYKATIDLAKKQGAEIIPPHIGWVKSCEEHGYPVVSKNISRRLGDITNTPIGCALALFNDTYGISDKWLHLTEKEFIDFKVSGYCCTEFKKNPSKRIKMNPILGTRIQESSMRKSAWKKSGCNSYSKDYKHGVSRPISLWLDNDVDEYVERENVELSELYTQYEQKRTGCCICPYGAQIDGSRFDLLKKLEPKRYESFIWKTKLGHILMVSDVDIVTDHRYMVEKQSMMLKVEMWREANKGNDRYLTFRCKKALETWNASEMCDALDYINKPTAKLKYDLEAIKQKLKELEESNLS